MSILPSLLKIYERLIYKHINQIEENTLSIYQCGFRKKYSNQHALVKLHALNFDINALSMVFDYLQEGAKSQN